MLQLLGLTTGLTLSAWGYAVGLGGINVTSALGQPLKAEIELVAVSRADKPSLVARLASPDVYKGAGLDYPAGVKYSFQIENRANGEPYLKLGSNREINDPFVSLLVELSWSSGKLMREYTFLLDPPGYVAEQPKPAAVQTITPAVVQSVPMPAEKPEAASLPVEKPAAPAAMPAERRGADREARVASGSVSVRTGDTLNKIAARNKPADVSLERMLVALYRANASQFDGKNMNRIRSGKIMRMPEGSELQTLTQAEAVQEIHAQATDWNAYRQKLAGAAATGRETGETKRVATGRITSTTTDKAPVASESAKEVLRLSKGDAPGDKVAKRSAQDRNAATEDAIAKAKAVNEEKTRAALLESNLKDMKRLAQLKAEAAALAASAASTQIASEVVSASSVAAASSVGAASAVAPASAVKPARVVKHAPVVVPEPSFFDTLLESPLAMGIGAAALLALGGLGIMLGRSRRATKKAEMAGGDETGTKTGQLTSPVAPSPETGDFTSTPVHVEEIAPHPDDVDPISEAELFLNFGRDEQAEEVLRDALKHSPDNHQIHLKLLSIYANRQDAESFAEIAALLQKTGDVEAIRQAEALAASLKPVVPPLEAEDGIEEAESATQQTPAISVPDEALFAAEVEPAHEAAEQEVGEIDFDVTAAPEAPEVDFDVTSTSPSMAVPEVLDFDLSAKVPDFAEADQHDEEALPNLDDLIFDVMSNAGGEANVETVAETPVEVPSFAADEADDGMEFTLDFPTDEAAEGAVPPPPPPALNLADISLDMDDIPAPAESTQDVVKSEHWHEVATKLDLAKAYQEMGDEVGAREILDEVMLEGDEAQKQEAQLLIAKLG